MDTSPDRFREIREFIDQSGKWDSLAYLVAILSNGAFWIFEDAIKKLMGLNLSIIVPVALPVIPLILLYRMHGNIKMHYQALVDNLQRKLPQVRLNVESQVKPLFGVVNLNNGTKERKPLRDTGYLEIENTGDERIEELTANVFLIEGDQRIRIPSYWIALRKNGQQLDVETIEAGKSNALPRDDHRTLAIANFGTGVGWTRLGNSTADAVCLMTPQSSPSPEDENLHLFRHIDTGQEEPPFARPAHLQIILTSPGQRHHIDIYLDMNGKNPKIYPEKPEAKLIM